MENNIFFGLIGKQLKITLADYSTLATERLFKGELIEISNEYIKINVKNKVVYLRQKYIVTVEEL